MVEWQCSVFFPDLALHTLTLCTLCATPLFDFSPPSSPSVWKPDLWETDKYHINSKLTLYLNNFDVKNDESTLMVSSGSLILADSFSLMYMSAYWLWENSDLGNRNIYLTAFLSGKLQFCVCLTVHRQKTEATLLECSALLWGEGGAVSVLDTFRFLITAARCLKHLFLTHFLLNQRLNICEWHTQTHANTHTYYVSLLENVISRDFPSLCFLIHPNCDVYVENQQASFYKLDQSMEFIWELMHLVRAC